MFIYNVHTWQHTGLLVLFNVLYTFEDWHGAYIFDTFSIQGNIIFNTRLNQNTIQALVHENTSNMRNKYSFLHCRTS